MQSNRLSALEYMRGVAMLGVIGIHVGSQYLTNPRANVHLVALLEVATRFSVPIFFFISAFGLFRKIDFAAPFDYRAFLRRRVKSVLVPYLAWSAFYILHYTILFRDPQLLNVRAIIKYLLFGFASYQLYFIVILIWFYLLMPLWIYCVRRLTLPRLAALLPLQIAFNYWSCNLLSPAAFQSPLLSYLVAVRLNYWPLHYLFIFLCGAYCSVHWADCEAFFRARLKPLAAFAALSLALLLGHYYYLIYALKYLPEWAINVAQQLSPAGVVYTLGASLFLLALFLADEIGENWRKILAFLGRHSYFAYLVHPVFITYISLLLARLNRLVTAPVAIFYYIAVAGGSLLFAHIFREKIGRRYPLVNKLTIGNL